MKLENVKSIIYDIVCSFFRGAKVIWAEQINTKPELPYLTLKTSGINKSRFPIIDEEGSRFYLCSTMLEINLYTKGNPITIANNVTGNYSNTATSDLNDFFNYLESEEIVDRLASEGLNISLEPPIRDLTGLQNDSKYRYRAMAESVVSFSIMANGMFGVSGNYDDLPNSSGGGGNDMHKDMIYIENIDIKQEE